jgi:hypothetical protein
MSSSHLEDAFIETVLTEGSKAGLDLPAPEREYRFDGRRKWRFDFAWPAQKVAVEVEGGIWANGRHVRGLGFSNDCEKYNAAAAQGWRILRVTAKQLEQPRRVFGWLIDSLGIMA